MRYQVFLRLMGTNAIVCRGCILGEADLQQVFADNLPWPTRVENNANASAIGELYSGEWNNYSDLTFIDLGYGIGAGVISGHKLLRGGFQCWGSRHGVPFRYTASVI